MEQEPVAEHQARLHELPGLPDPDEEANFNDGLAQSLFS